ncbi:efflux RND transporter permease subunit [Desulfomonile tiedjei]|uniref:Hydrophobe/amphiphile efflux-1 (HAE1) family transporter n=1 Tax=Desulfomonile tiedjei (strain ATCC 49306 / DSM 6799 / DCB-1) TaxID=706587 RepID=I4C5S2_DESTA|nr:multidrug efflux RND transporter permease subunit [Desulfomonile tiedjei]AFM24913.1 hydrophobe/amphiphile efflux-1 (HAE1) family transporter [Desulfomonile tiedjei DSM 6799]
MFSRFFIERPIFASVISIVIVFAGAVAILSLPIAQYPEIVPPVVQVKAYYPGADPQVIAETVAAPIEQQVNGVENMLYMSSQSSADGSYTLNVTFELGTDIDMNTVLTQNRVSAALSQLPEEVQRQGVTTKKVSSALVAVISFYSPEGRYDDLFITNYLTINVKDVLSRIRGVGDISTFPTKDYSMRIWLDPDKLRARGITVDDVVKALRQQNVQVASGQLGQPPVPKDQAYQINVNTLGRLTDVEQFSDIIIKTGEGTRAIRVKDVARVDLGGKAYDFQSLFNGQPAATLIVYQSPGSNAIEVTENLTKAMDELKKTFPQGLEYRVIYKISDFIDASIHEVIKTLFEAFLLVVIVVFVFLQNWRATLIPLIAIPVSLIGTFAVMPFMGFSINMVTLFGLVLAIGIVVDDAIVVVENVERNMAEHGMNPKEAAIRSMEEVTGAIIGTTLVLMAVFVPPAFMGGITGQLFRQFSLTIAISTFFSALNALTMSPAMCALILKPGHGSKNFFFRGFNTVFDRTTNWYTRVVSAAIRRIGIAMILFVGLVVIGVLAFQKIPGGFLPLEDDGLVLVNVQMPDGATLNRTYETAQAVGKVLDRTDGVESWGALIGYSMIDSARSNLATFFVPLKPWEERLAKGRSRDVIMKELYAQFQKIPEGTIFPFTLPPVIGLGTGGGFEMQLLDKANLGFPALQEAGNELARSANSQPDLTSVVATFRATYPAVYLDIDRTKALALKVPLESVFDTLQTYLGSAYVNDFTKFSRTWQVRAQAESAFRRNPEDISQLYVRSSEGKMIPLGTLVSARYEVGPMRVDRYNLFPTSKVMGSPAPGFSSGQALDTMEQLAKKVLPPGMSFEWTNMAFEEKKSAGKGSIVFLVAIFVVILVLAALYESWTDPLAVVLIVPLAVLGSAIGLLIAGLDNNLYTQVGLVLLVGLSAKNAILIVEFARDTRAKGKGLYEAVVEASKLRFRPILMTSFAFILGVLPLVSASGAGAVSRVSVGTVVFAGMLGVTILGVFFTPALYVLMQGRRKNEYQPPQG